MAGATLAAFQGDVQRVARQLDSDLDEGVRALLWAADGAGWLSLTGLGEVLARTWVAPATLAVWRELLAPTERAPGRAACLLLLALAEEWHSLPMLVEPGDRRGHRWPTGLVERLGADDPLARQGAALLTSAAGVPVAHHRAARLALALDDWLAGDPLPDLERAHGLSTGLLHRVATTAAWLARSAMEVAGALRRPVAVVGVFEELAEALAGLLRDPAFALTAQVESSPAADAQSPASPVAPPAATPPPPDDIAMQVPVVAAQLVFPANDPGCVVFCGRRVALTPTEYRLLETLARSAGRTVTYKQIDAAVWPDVKVCRDQVRQHRNALEAKLGPAAEALFRTRRRWGIDVLIDPAAIRWDADADRAAG